MFTKTGLSLKDKFINRTTAGKGWRVEGITKGLLLALKKGDQEPTTKADDGLPRLPYKIAEETPKRVREGVKTLRK